MFKENNREPKLKGYTVKPVGFYLFLVEGSLEVQLPTIWTVEKAKQSSRVRRWKKQRREVESEERRYNGAKVSRKKMHRREMLGKSRNAVFFNDLCVGWVEK